MDERMDSLKWARFEESARGECTYDPEGMARALVEQLIGYEVPVDVEFTRVEIRDRFTNYKALDSMIGWGHLMHRTSLRGGYEKCMRGEDESSKDKAKRILREAAKDCDKMKEAHRIIREAANKLVRELRAEWKERRALLESQEGEVGNA